MALTQCIVTGFLKDLEGNNITSGCVGVVYTGHLISDDDVIPITTGKVPFDNDGRFQITLFETATSPNSVTARFNFEYSQGGMNRTCHFADVIIPNTTSATFTSLSGVT